MPQHQRESRLEARCFHLVRSSLSVPHSSEHLRESLFFVSFFKFSSLYLCNESKSITQEQAAARKLLTRSRWTQGTVWWRVEQAGMLGLNKEMGCSWEQGRRERTNLGFPPWNSAAWLRMYVKKSCWRAFLHSSIRTWRIVVDYKLMRFADRAPADGCIRLEMHRRKLQLGSFMVASNRKAAVLVSCIAI